MQPLSILFPKRSGPRTVVHAGPLLRDRPGWLSALRGYLRYPRRREVILLHDGETDVSRVAEEVGVTDLTFGKAPAGVESLAACETAVAMGAARVDFAIDDAAVRDVEGFALQEITASEAAALAELPELHARIRGKLRAAAEGLRNGLARVRIGDPSALLRNRSTVIVPDGAFSLDERKRSPAIDTLPPVNAHTDQGLLGDLKQVEQRPVL